MRHKKVMTKLLQSVTEVYYKVCQVLQSVIEGYYKVRQVLWSVTDCYPKCCYYKVCHALESVTVITKWDVTMVRDSLLNGILIILIIKKMLSVCKP